MTTKHAKRERAMVAVASLALVVAGLGAVATSPVWPVRLSGLIVVAGASLALVAEDRPIRVVGAFTVLIGLSGVWLFGGT